MDDMCALRENQNVLNASFVNGVNILTKRGGHSVNHIIPDYNMSFDEYIERCKTLIHERFDKNKYPSLDHIVECNSPYEIKPTHATNSTGVLFIHGLLDSPFTLRELATECAKAGMLCRSVLLPGHATTPEDLNEVHYKNWINTVSYGVKSLAKEVDRIFLVGYSMGATLSLYHIHHQHNIAGLVIIAPAIKIKFPADPLFRLTPYVKYWEKHAWIKVEDEIDYTKYRSLPYHAVFQLYKLTHKINTKKPINCPLFIITTRNDETISTDAAIALFKTNDKPQNKLLLYTTQFHYPDDARIIERNSYLPEQNIVHFSHRSLPFSKNNSHYGIHGDYSLASHPKKNIQYGAYIGLLGVYYNVLHSLYLTDKIRQELTYNPDFDFMSKELVDFIKHSS